MRYIVSGMSQLIPPPLDFLQKVGGHGGVRVLASRKANPTVIGLSLGGKCELSCTVVDMPEVNSTNIGLSVESKWTLRCTAVGMPEG